MGLDVIPQRGASQRENSEWENVFQRVLAGNLIPRNSAAAPVNAISSLGSANFRWFAAHLGSMKFLGNSKFASIKPHASLASDYVIKLPTQPPSTNKKALLYVNSTGDSVFVDIDDSTLEATDSAFRVKDQGITLPKLPDPAVQSSNLGNLSTSSTSFQTVKDTTPTTISISVTTIGRPVSLSLVSKSGGTSSRITGEGSLRFMRDSTEIARYGSNVGAYPVTSFWTVDAPSAGTYTYTIEAKATSPSSYTVGNAWICGFEML